ncbi:TIGR01621 family pseudouridine synthase [Paraferrimonas sp. SM1919]|uniref:TIGR01621 family pseudouridine synthase n=1 Tax=Paraferrimonas sp. SM1919 TaxID=2662263 RepID=UPI0013D5635E|nr:TIGR01621 family pseudouridine synthase [Paraferrimonas sp. SM1919]
MYDIISDQPDFIVINKNPFVHFHSQDGNAGVIAQLSDDIDQDLFPVHRLDTMTSGVLLIAKSSSAAAELSKAFRDRQTQKFYLAIAQGKPKKKQGLIKGDMAKARRGQWKLMKTNGNPAITQFFSHSLGQGLRAYLLKPHSGKTHQLRVALKSLGTAILGDELYGGGDADRGYLHAWQLSIPFKGELLHFVAPLPNSDHSPLINQGLPQDWQTPNDLNWPSL